MMYDSDDYEHLWDDPVDVAELAAGYIKEDDEWSHPSEGHALCLFGIGDSHGMCIREKFGCNIVGCDLSDAE
jgi:hypothetical protein